MAEFFYFLLHDETIFARPSMIWQLSARCLFVFLCFLRVDVSKLPIELILGRNDFMWLNQFFSIGQIGSNIFGNNH